MTEYGFYFDADNCVACHACQVACKDAHDLPVGVNYRLVRSFCTGEGFTPHWYNVSLPLEGCDFCASTREEGEQPVCVASCMTRAIEWGPMDELRAAHAGELLAETTPAIKPGDAGKPQVMRIRECMLDEDFDEFRV